MSAISFADRPVGGVTLASVVGPCRGVGDAGRHRSFADKSVGGELPPTIRSARCRSRRREFAPVVAQLVRIGSGFRRFGPMLWPVGAMVRRPDRLPGCTLLAHGDARRGGFPPGRPVSVGRGAPRELVRRRTRRPGATPRVGRPIRRTRPTCSAGAGGRRRLPHAPPPRGAVTGVAGCRTPVVTSARPRRDRRPTPGVRLTPTSRSAACGVPTGVSAGRPAAGRWSPVVPRWPRRSNGHLGRSSADPGEAPMVAGGHAVGPVDDRGAGRERPRDSIRSPRRPGVAPRILGDPPPSRRAGVRREDRGRGSRRGIAFRGLEGPGSDGG